MQVVKRCLKTTVLTCIITVTYAIFNKVELPLLFCVCYALQSGNIAEVTVISVVMGIISCAFGKYTFLYGVFLCLYASYAFMIFKPKKKPFLKNLVLFFVFAIICLGQDFIYSILFFAPVYYLVFKIYNVK